MKIIMLTDNTQGRPEENIYFKSVSGVAKHLKTHAAKNSGTIHTHFSFDHLSESIMKKFVAEELMRWNDCGTCSLIIDIPDKVSELYEMSMVEVKD